MSTKNKSAGTQFTPKGATQGVTLVDPVTGKPVSTVEDSNGVRRIAVDGNFVAQNVQAQVNLDSDEDEVAVEDPDTGAHIRVEPDGSINANVEVDAADGDNIGLKVQNRTTTPSDAQYNKRVTAKTGTGANNDTTSMDVSLHDHQGNEFTETNQFPTNSSIRDGANPAIKATVNTDNELETDNDSVHSRNEAFNKSTAIGGELDDASTVAATEGNVSPARITPQRALHTNLRNNSGGELLGEQLGANSIPVVPSREQTYSASIVRLASVASATDIFTITGSATKTVKVKRIAISGTQTTHSWRDILAVKRSTANTGGSSTAPTRVPHDSNNNAATATVLAYTANPTLGTLVGTIRSGKMSMSQVTPSNAQSNGPGNHLIWDFGADGGQPIILRGTSQVLAINLNGVTIAGASFDINIEWTEE